ncbi:MAG TPA: sigma-70 family RNA polymerase sigma factor [Acidobacteriaceae bacterium]|jgi:RNA polymerase sigma-70 factor (ECF subfamily)|nr:sigma-70 family RNA polymerase sigma factor [Acidobacteriaceae bacterium]
MHLTDEQLVDAARDGNENAFSELFLRHQKRLLMLALQYRLTTQDAEDAVQQTMLKAWQGLAGFRGESRFATWITRVLINEVFQLQRRRARMRLEEMESATLTATLESGSRWTPRELSQEQRLLAIERNRVVHASLRALPESLRSVLRMQFFDERSLEEIAAEMDRPLATVKSRRHRARLELRKRFAERLRSVDPSLALS